MQYESFLDQARAARATERLAQMETEKQEFLALVQLYGVLCDNYELQPDNHSSKALKDFLAKHPNVPNYDTRGNWIGSSRNENGWSA